MFVLIDEPKPPGYGGTIAAPLFAKLMPEVLRALGVPPDNPDQVSGAAGGSRPGEKEQEPAKVAVPDARFLPADWALQRLRRCGAAAEGSPARARW